MYDYLGAAYVFLFVANPLLCIAYFIAFIGFKYDSSFYRRFWKLWAYPFASLAVSFAYLLSFALIPLFFYKDFDLIRLLEAIPFSINWHSAIISLYIVWICLLGAVWYANWDEYQDQKRRSASREAETLSVYGFPINDTMRNDTSPTPLQDQELFPCHREPAISTTPLQALETILFKKGFLKAYSYIAYTTRIVVNFKFKYDSRKSYTRRLFIWHDNGSFFYKIYTGCEHDIENGMHVAPAKMDCSAEEFAELIMSLDFRGMV